MKKKVLLDKIRAIGATYNVVAHKHRMPSLVMHHLEHFEREELERAYIWIKRWEDDLSIKYAEIRALRNEDIWTMYEYMGSNDLREVQELNRILTHIRNYVSTRPQVFKKKAVTHGKTEQPIEDRDGLL